MTIWKVKALSKVPLLQHVGQNDLEDMCEKLQEETFEDGDLICKEGDVGESCDILQSGTCVVIKAQGTGDKAIARLEPGQYFGEIALLRDDPRTATIKATSPVKLLVLKRKDFFDVVKDFYQALTMKIGKIDAQDSGHSHLPSKLCPGDLKILKTLGHGAFGKVYLVRCRHNNMKYALKCIKKEKVIASKLTEHVVREKQVMEHLQSPFLVSLAASFQDRRHLYMLMRLAEGGELFNYLSNRSSSLSENEAKFYAGCVVMGLDYLHERGVSWRYIDWHI
jgi:cGMP-dependent protein kinase